jgi:hypothetical protein
MFKITIDHADHTGIIGELMKPILKRGGTMREFGCIDKRYFKTFVYEVIYEK